MDPITFGSGALTILSAASALAGIHSWLTNFEMERLIQQLDLKIDRLSDHILHAPATSEVSDTSRTRQAEIRDPRALVEMLDPMQRALDTTILSTAVIPTPVEFQSAFGRDPMKVLFDIQPIDHFKRASDPDLVPIFFADANTYYVGWQKREVLSLFNCSYDSSSHLFLPQGARLRKESVSDGDTYRPPLLDDHGLIAASLDGVDCLHLALAPDKFPAQVRIENKTSQILRNLKVFVWVRGAEPGSRLSSTTWTGGVAQLDKVFLDRVRPDIGTQALRDATVTAKAKWWIEVQVDGDVVFRGYQAIDVLPPRSWLLNRAPPPVLAAFVLSESPIVAELVAEAAGRVDVEDRRPAIVKAYEALEGLFESLGLEPRGSRDQVVGPRTLVERGQASRVEYQLLMAACLEHGGMPPMLIWSASGPALGLWLSDNQPSLVDTDDPVIVERLVDIEDLKVLPVGPQDGESSQSGNSKAFCALNLRHARKHVAPLPLEVLEDKPLPTSELAPNGLRQRLLDRAALSTPYSGIRVPGAWSAQLDPPMEEVPERKRFESWKRRLLNLTMQNPLLNLRHRVTTLPLMIADVGALEDELASGKSFDLVSRPEAPPGRSLPPVTPQRMGSAMRAGELIVDLPKKQLATSAKRAWGRSRTAQSEGGVNTLFLTIGLLHWVETGKSRRGHTAPLLLIPVELKKVGRGGCYRLEGAEDDPGLNAALLEYLRRHFQIEFPDLDPLPEDHSGVDVPAVLTRLRTALAEDPTTADWHVEEKARIDILSFAGYRMWRDLHQHSDALLEHPLVNRLNLGTDSRSQPAELPRANLLDKWDPAEVFCPLEADSSQLVAIRAATDGLSFVLEGPPGTGKSQTIANLICHCLTIGKTVLFVSQKRAALEVVQAKLEDVGLGPVTLALHSEKGSKNEFIRQLREAKNFSASHPKNPKTEWAREAEELADARRELNRFVEAVHLEREPNRLTAFEVAVELDALSDVRRLRGDFHEERSLDVKWLRASRKVMERLGPALEDLGDARRPLGAVRTTDWPLDLRERLGDEIGALRQAASDLESACANLSPWHPDLERASAEDLQLVDGLLEEIRSSPRPTQALLAGNMDEVTSWLGHLEPAVKLADKLDRSYLPTLLDQPLEKHVEFLRAWIEVPALGWVMNLWVWRQYLTLARNPPVPQGRQLWLDLRLALELRNKKRIVDASFQRMTALLGPLRKNRWGLPVIDFEETRQLLSWSRGFHGRAAGFPALLLLASGDAPESAAAPVEAFRCAYSTFERCCRQTGEDTLQLDDGWATSTNPGYCAAVSARAEELRQHIGSLRDWGRYSRTREEARKLGHDPFVQALEDGQVAPQELLRAFEKNWRLWWLSHWSKLDEALLSYDGNQQQDREKAFAKLDVKLRELVQGEVLVRLSKRQCKAHLDGAPPNSEPGLLNRQLRPERKRFESPRRLFKDCPTPIRALKPCVLMSPQSVAQYLDPSHLSRLQFDLVIFDEASQVPVHEAIGAIARGKQVVVVGDSMQLPPTMFFKDRDQESDEDDLMVELDSILGECRASGLASLDLAWHYRSRHPSLIAFSNRRYYDNRLQVLPAAAEDPRLGISRVLVPKAIYDRGGNEVEAAELVKEVVRRLCWAAEDPKARKPSLGVVTFSAKQQMLVEDLLEEECARCPQIEQFFTAGKEPVFVKNLENVQGDERDVILFSIGYGPNQEGHVRANFGPLNQEGGEHRLNVAVTRARRQLVAFVSFECDELDLSRTRSKGLHDLKAFLESAAVKGEARVGSEELEEDPASSALKNALAKRLRDEGHEVEMDVGVGAYRLDLAIRDPERKGTFALGIEVDGRRYGETPTARDRDRLRWQVLQGLGWHHLYRVRGLEWREDPKRTVSKVLEILEEACKAEIPPDGLGQVEPMLFEDHPEGPKKCVKHLDAAHLDNTPQNQATYEPEATYHRWAPRKRQKFHLGHPTLARLVARIVETEAPVSERLVSQRIKEAWRLDRTPPGLAGQIGAIVARIGSKNRPRQQKDGFLWPREVDPECWRGYRVPDPEKPDSFRRKVADIPLEELANAAADLSLRYPGTPDDELPGAVAKVFGIQSLNKVVLERIEAGIRLARTR